MDDVLDPVAALREVAYLLERSSASSYRVRAFRNAADVVASLTPQERAAVDAAGSWADLPGLGRRTAGIVAEAMAGRIPAYLTGLRSQQRPLAVGGDTIRAVLRGDLHTHTDWSDGTVPLPEMVAAAARLGHDYLAVTDHSPRLRVARGLSAERLAGQIEAIAEVNRRSEGIRVLTGVEVDILADGRLDQSAAMLARVDVVVASVHSQLRMDAETMTRRMVAAVANPHVDVLGHCTGRLIAGERGLRPQSLFEAEVVFEACRVFDVAVEINARPERLDPPDDLLRLAADLGCVFAINTDAHAPGQLEFLDYGAARAEAAGIAPERIVTTWTAERLLSWTGNRAP